MKKVMEKDKLDKEEIVNSCITTTSTASASISNTIGSGFGVFTSKKMSETFLRTLECPVCLEIVLPPVISCTLGHIICSMCRPKLSKCGLCGTNFTNIRNFPIEAMLALVETDCRYSSCGLKLMADKLKDHLVLCEYRPIPCNESSPNSECKGTLINFEDYTKHLTDIHGKSYVDLSNEFPEFVVFDVSTTFHGSQLLGVMNYKSKTFFLRRDYVFQRHYAMCWVTALAPEAIARKFVFHLKISDAKDPKRSMEWRIRAHSVHTPPDLTKSTGDCAFIPYDALIPFCERKFIPTPNGQLLEYKWSMVGKVTETDLPPQANSMNQLNSVISTQVNPLNLCSSGCSTRGNPSTGISSSSTNHGGVNTHSNPALSFPGPGVPNPSNVAAGSSIPGTGPPLFSHGLPQMRHSIPTGFNFAFSSNNDSLYSTASITPTPSSFSRH